MVFWIYKKLGFINELRRRMIEFFNNGIFYVVDDLINKGFEFLIKMDR